MVRLTLKTTSTNSQAIGLNAFFCRHDIFLYRLPRQFLVIENTFCGWNIACETAVDLSMVIWHSARPSLELISSVSERDNLFFLAMQRWRHQTWDLLPSALIDCFVIVIIESNFYALIIATDWELSRVRDAWLDWKPVFIKACIIMKISTKTSDTY